MDQQDMNASTTDSGWPEISANVSLARGTARSITLDTQRASADGRILELTSQLEEMRARLGSFEEHMFTADTSANNDELLPRFASLDEELGATTARFEELATRVARAEENISSTMIVSIEGFDSRLALVEDARLTQSNELNGLTSYLEQAFTRIAELAELIEEERIKNASGSNEIDWASTGALDAVRAQVDALGQTVAEISQQVEQTSATIDSTTTQIDDALVMSVAELDARVAATEHRLNDLDGVSTSIEFLTSRADALDARQNQTTEEADRYRSEIIEHVDRAHSRIDDAQLELLELRTQIELPQTQAPDLSDDLHALQQTVGTAVDAQRELATTLADAQESIDANRRGIERANADTVTSRELVHDVSDRIANLSETADLISQRVDLVQNTSDDLQGRVESVRAVGESTDAHVQQLDQGMHNLESRLDNAAVGLEAAHARVDEVDTAAAAAHTRIEDTSRELAARIDEVDTAAAAAHTRIEDTSRELAARIDENVASLDSRFGEANQHLEERLEQTAAEVNERIADSTQNVEHQLNETVQHVEQRLQETAQHAQHDSVRIDEVDARSSQSHHRLDELGERFTSFDARLSDTDGRIEDIERSATEAAQRSTQLSAKLDQTIDCIEGTVAATADIAGRVTATEDQIAAGSEELTATRQHLESSVSRVEEIASRALSISEGLQQSIHADVEERTQDLQEHLLTRVDEARAQLQHALETSHAQSTHAREEFESSISDRLHTVQESVENRLSEVVQNANNDARIETLESTVASVQDNANEAIGAAQEAAGVAHEAYAFSDSLRQLQTDIVQAIQDELRIHGNQLGSFGERLQHVESTGAGFASGERVQMLEAKLVEALQTLSQLTQLQRRNTSVEAQLTDTLTATSHGVESTQANVAMLRDDLQAAKARIAHLEQLLAGTSTTSPVSTQASISLDDPAYDRQAAPTASRTQSIPTSGDADTGWFTESYARKNQEPKAS